MGGGNPGGESVDLLEGDAEHVGQVSVGEQLPEVGGLDVSRVFALFIVCIVGVCFSGVVHCVFLSQPY